MKLGKISKILKKAKKTYKKESNSYDEFFTELEKKRNQKHMKHYFKSSLGEDIEFDEDSLEIEQGGNLNESYEDKNRRLFEENLKLTEALRDSISKGNYINIQGKDSDAKDANINIKNDGTNPNLQNISQSQVPTQPINQTSQTLNQAASIPSQPPQVPLPPVLPQSQDLVAPPAYNISNNAPSIPLPKLPEGVPGPGGTINIVSKNYIGDGEALESEDISETPKEKKHISLAKLPDNILKSSSTDWEPINFRGVDDEYELYGPTRVKIYFNEEHQKLIYYIIEPELNEEEQEKLDELKRAFVYVFEKFSLENITTKGREIIVDGTKKLASRYKIKLTDEETERITYYLIRDFLGLEMIEPIMHDHYIEDISCDGLNVPIFVNHLKYGALEVNREYNDTTKLNSFIVKLAQKSNQEVSLSKPILQGALPDGSRVEAIYGKEISEKGSSFTIRKFRAEPFTPIHLIEFGTMPPFLLAYLWLAVENKQSILVSGGTATGKTTILNALSLFAPPTSKIVSIEDTPEINLPHEHWLPMVARESEGKGEVSMFDLLKASLRERPDYIIVGEIRGAEAAILFQGMATGHAGLGTVHAEKFSDLVNRMTIDPINLPPQLITELNIAIFMKQVKVKENVVRRVFSVVEIIDYDSKRDKFETNEFVSFVPREDTFNFEEKSAVMSHLLEIRGGEEDSLWTEIEKRRRILDVMHKNKVTEFADVSSVIKSYYKDPKNIFSYLEELEKKKEGENNGQ